MYTPQGRGCVSWPLRCNYNFLGTQEHSQKAEADSKEKHGVWNPMPELTITSPYVHSRVDYNTFTMIQPYAYVDINPMPESTLTYARVDFSPVRDFGFGLNLILQRS
jgi:hypothetical protein